jgi:hypothetical protein
MDANTRRQIEYAKKRLRRKYRGPDLTSGDLVQGKYYAISIYGSGNDFKNVGAQKNAAGEIFKATGATPSTWTSSVLSEIKLDQLKSDADAQFDTRRRLGPDPGS